MNEWLQAFLFQAAGSVDKWRYGAIGLLLAFLGVLALLVYGIIDRARRD